MLEIDSRVLVAPTTPSLLEVQLRSAAVMFISRGALIYSPSRDDRSFMFYFPRFFYFSLQVIHVVQFLYIIRLSVPSSNFARLVDYEKSWVGRLGLINCFTLYLWFQISGPHYQSDTAYNLASLLGPYPHWLILLSHLTLFQRKAQMHKVGF